MIASRWRLPEAPRPSRASSRGTAAFSCVPALALALVFSGHGSLHVDIDRSERVDGFDLAILARAFGRGKGEDLYSLAADVGGRVDGTDLAIPAARFGASL